MQFLGPIENGVKAPDVLRKTKLYTPLHKSFSASSKDRSIKLRPIVCWPITSQCTIKSLTCVRVCLVRAAELCRMAFERLTCSCSHVCHERSLIHRCTNPVACKTQSVFVQPNPTEKSFRKEINKKKQDPHTRYLRLCASKAFIGSQLRNVS